MQTPRPHQVTAIKSCVRGLRKPGSRGQCIMACGTGKTLVGFEVAQGLKAKHVLALVPSLLLVQQMIREYRARGAANILAVCSDDVSSGEDSIQISVKELGEDATTDAKRAREFLAGDGQQIVVCTYQSLRSLSEVFDTLEFDLAIFDEAHKTAGIKSKLFAHGLTDDTLKVARRLFMTATPRHSAIKEDGSESEVFAMNNPKIYGKVLYSLPMRKAIEEGIIDDYRIVVAVTKTPKAEDLKGHAIRVAIDKAMQQFKIRKVFTFHSRVDEAAAFIDGATDTLKGSRLYHVSGKQSSAERARKLEGFRSADSALMTNARCLTEGVDLPAADMVAFLAPKRNPIDIVQAIGRVLRKHASKATGGYVFLPVFVDESEDEEAAVAASDWAGVYEVLQALREQDEPMAAQLSACARGEGGIPDRVTVMRGEGVDDLGSDSAAFSEAVKEKIRAKMMRPFARDSRGKKNELLCIARSKGDRPLAKTRLGIVLLTYTKPRANGSYDDEFNTLIRKIAPSWFVDKTKENKENLIRLAREGASRPSSGKGQKLGVALIFYTNKSGGGSYDADFSRRIRKIAPKWFMKRSQVNKIELIRMAKDGEKKPICLGRGSLGVQLSDYTKEGSSTYDSTFSRRIRKIAPEWFRDKTKEIKERIMELASKNRRKPSARTRIGERTNAYVSERSKQYDPIFAGILRGIAPHWFKETTEEKKVCILRMARAGEKRPNILSKDKHERSLCASLLKSTHRKGRYYHESFDKEIRSVAPHWFKK
jgi:superfamily II DNA or RNA helicase